MLHFRFEESSDLFVVASNYGQDHHPAWYLNIAADSQFSVEVKGGRLTAEARITRGEERAAVFDRVVAANSRFATYRSATGRRIPVIAFRRV